MIMMMMIVVVVVVVVEVVVVVVVVIIIIIIIIIALKGEIRDFLQSPHSAVSNTYAQVARAQSRANHVLHVGRSSRAARRVPLGTKAQLSY